MIILTYFKLTMIHEYLYAVSTPVVSGVVQWIPLPVVWAVRPPARLEQGGQRLVVAQNGRTGHLPQGLSVHLIKDVELGRDHHYIVVVDPEIRTNLSMYAKLKRTW